MSYGRINFNGTADNQDRFAELEQERRASTRPGFALTRRKKKSPALATPGKEGKEEPSKGSYETRKEIERH